MSQPPFTMSKYASETELLRDKCAWLEKRLADSTGYAEQLTAALGRVRFHIDAIVPKGATDAEIIGDALREIDAALAKNPNPSGQFAAEPSPAKAGTPDPAVTNEDSGPVGLGPQSEAFPEKLPLDVECGLHKFTAGCDTMLLLDYLRRVPSAPTILGADYGKPGGDRTVEVHGYTDPKDGSVHITGYVEREPKSLDGVGVHLSDPSDALAEAFCRRVKWHPDGTSNTVVDGDWRSITFREMAKNYLRAAADSLTQLDSQSSVKGDR